MLTKVLPKKSAGNQSSAFAAFVSDEDSCAAVIKAANDLGLTDPPVTKGVIKDAIQHLAKASTPELLVVDLSGSADPLAEITSLAEVCDEGTRVVTVGDLNDIELYRNLVAIGVNDYLLKPISAADLGAAFTRVHEAPQTEAQPAEQGRLITIIGARGGVGATSVAVNCAWSIAHELKKRVALIDLDIFFGNCGLALDLESGRGFREALENPSRIDGLFIERAMIRESDNLYVLSAEETLEQSLNFNASAVELLLDHLRRDFQYVILDLPRYGARTQSSILVPPASMLVVSDPTLPGMRDTMRLVKLFKKTAPKTDICVALNRVGANKNGELSKGDFERGAEVKVDQIIPSDPKAFAASASTGKPLAKVEKSGKTTAAIRELGMTIAKLKAEPAKTSVWQKLIKGKK